MAKYSWKDFCEKVQNKSVGPIDMWEYISNTDDKEFPLVVTEYLKDVAGALLSLDRTGKDFPQGVVDALHLKQSDLSARHGFSRDFQLYLFVMFKNQTESINLDDCYKLASDEFNLATGSVEKIYKRMRKEININNKEELGG